MPYPEETGETPSSTQREETLSDTEKHWNQVILAILAIGTTVLGVTLVVYGRSDETPSQENLFRLIQATATVFALAIYLAAFLYMARTMFPPLVPVGPPRLVQKRRMANTVVTLFTLLAMTAAVVIFTEIVSRETPVSEEPINRNSPERDEQIPTASEPTAGTEVPGTEPPFTPIPTPTLK